MLMRTSKQGQAAVSGEREHRRRRTQVPDLRRPGPWENILRTVTDVERYPEVPAGQTDEAGASGITMGALRTWFFVLCQMVLPWGLRSCVCRAVYQIGGK